MMKSSPKAAAIRADEFKQLSRLTGEAEDTDDVDEDDAGAEKQASTLLTH